MIFISTLSILGQALGKNMTTIFVTHFFGGVFASASQTIGGGGFLADIWDVEGRGPALTISSASIFLVSALSSLQVTSSSQATWAGDGTSGPPGSSLEHTGSSALYSFLRRSIPFCSSESPSNFGILIRRSTQP
jgi:hypothetical protein